MPSVIKCIVQGKRIEEVLRALKPFALEPPVVEVIDNSATSPAQPNKSNGLVQEATKYVAKLIKSGAKTVTSKQMQDFCESLGSKSYSYTLHRLVGTKVLKRTKDIKIYEIVR